MAKATCICPDTTPAWMTTFSDLMSLLLCFFVLLVSMATTKENDFMVGSGALQGAFGVMALNPSVLRLKYVAMPTMKNIQRAIIDKMKSNMQDFIEANNMGDAVKILITDKGVALTLSAPLFFKSGSAELKQEVFPLLARIFDIAQGWPNIIRIEGHTDNTRIHSELYASNWDLSFARALSVLRFAVDFSKIHPSRLVPVAYGEYKPVADNSTEEGRAKNRRIELLMEYKKESEDPFK